MSSIDALNAPAFPEWVSDRFETHLNPIGRLNLLAVGLRIAPRKEALQLVDAFMADNAAGNPLPSLVSAMDDARWHASTATPQERKAYSLAHFEALPKQQQSGFLEFVQGGIAA